MSLVDVGRADAPSLIELRSACRTYPGPTRVRALHEVDLVIRRGCYLAVVGPSGSGKSTLLNVLGLLDVLDAGRYVLDGTEVDGLTDRERTGLRAHRIGFVFQSFHLVREWTVSENVELGLLYSGVRRRDRRERAALALEQTGLSRRRSAQASTLSGGEAQRVALARAIVRRPQLLLADEPTGNLDSGTSGRILDLLEALQDQLGLTTIVVTHDRSVAARAQDVVRVVDGAVGLAS
jgi:putative ABC transport system ATP-binding protein